MKHSIYRFFFSDVFIKTTRFELCLYFFLFFAFLFTSVYLNYCLPLLIDVLRDMDGKLGA